MYKIIPITKDFFKVIKENIEYKVDLAKKTTCLWLKGLPKLTPTNIVSEGEFYISPNGAKMPKWLSDPVDKNGKKIAYNSDEIKKLRSKTFPGVAKAMAEQWTTKPKVIQCSLSQNNKKEDGIPPTNKLVGILPKRL